jgi:hypothetical protein
MDYECSQTFSGDPAKALDTAATVLAGSGFRIESRTSSSLSVSGPGMLSSKQHPLCGVSSAQFNAAGNSLSVRADLGGVRKMMTFITVMIGTMAVVLASVLFILVFYRGQPAGVLLSLLAFAPWVVLLPVMTRLFTSRTRRALDTLLHNMATL